MPRIIEVAGGLQISQEVKDKQRMVLDRLMVEVGDKYPLATIVVSLATLAHSVINHQGWEEICILYQRNCQIVQMIMGLRLEKKQVLVA